VFEELQFDWIDGEQWNLVTRLKELLDGGGVESGRVVGPNVGDGESRMQLMVALELWKGWELLLLLE
jgi:hypothetical protein